VTTRQLTRNLTAGLPTRASRTVPDAVTVLDAHRHVTAQVITRPTRGVRVNFRRANPLPPRAPKRLRELVRPTRSPGQWGAFAYVEDEADAPLLHALLAELASAA